MGLMVEARMMARPSPRRVPSAMLATVRKMVSISPRRMDSWVKYFATTSHLKFGFVATELRTPIPTRMQTTQETYSNVLRRFKRGFNAESNPLITLLLSIVTCFIGAPTSSAWRQ